MKPIDNQLPRDGAKLSPWTINIAEPIVQNIANADTVYDVIIVGAGITGISTALMLQRSGKQCLIIEAAKFGFGTTGGTSAHLNTFFDATYPEVESDFGKDAAKLLADAGKDAMNTIRSLVEEYQIDCDLEVKEGLLFSETEKETKQLLEILRASREAGIDVIETEDNGVPLLFDKVLRFADQGQFHPIKYVSALLNEYIKLGGILLEGTFVKDAVYENDIHVVDASGMNYKSLHLIYATHTPPGVNVMNFNCAPYRSYILGVELAQNNYPQGLVYDMQEPYHYFRTHEIDGVKYLIVGGEDHKTGHDEPETAFDNLEKYVFEHYKVKSVAFHWSSQYYVPVDGLPYIGALPMSSKHIYCATGFNGNGMMFSTLSALILTDEILGRDSKYSKLFSPSRIKPVAGFTEFVKENADVAWHFIADRFSSDDLSSVAELKYNQGIVAEVNGQKLALHKDETGKIRALSPTCTHTGCVVKFNAAEKSWDCPCHGGRFDLDGKVITGPPRKDLEQVHI